MLKRLSKREHDILRLLSKGMTNREIGKAQFLSERTVEWYITSLRKKFMARNRVQLAVAYITKANSAGIF